MTIFLWLGLGKKFKQESATTWKKIRSLYSYITLKTDDTIIKRLMTIFYESAWIRNWTKQIVQYPNKIK